MWRRCGDGMGVIVGVSVAVDAGVAVGEDVGVDEGVAVGEDVGVDDGVAVGKGVGVDDGVGMTFTTAVATRSKTAIGAAVGIGVDMDGMSVAAGEGVGMTFTTAVTTRSKTAIGAVVGIGVDSDGSAKFGSLSPASVDTASQISAVDCANRCHSIADLSGCAYMNQSAAIAIASANKATMPRIEPKVLWQRRQRHFLYR